jgi:LCP family protein required for cell wall assembly
MHHPLRWSAAMGVIVLIAWTVGPAISAYRSVDRIDGNADDAARTLLSSAEEQLDSPSQPLETEPMRPEPISGETTFLLVGTDDRTGLDDLSDFGEFEGRRADVVVLATVRPEQNEVRLVSLPRDLVAPDLCGEFDEIRLADVLDGCGSIPGETLLQLTVERMTSIGIDHVASVGLDGFQEAVDRLGGYEICLEHPVRDPASGLDLPAGCTTAEGEQTLAWIRSRRTEELVDGRWRTIPGANDLARNERERAFLIDMFERIIDAINVRQLQGLAAVVAPHIALDTSLDLPRLIQTGWHMRLLTTDDIDSVAVPVVDDTLRGMAVLRPTVGLETFLSE